MSSFYQPHQNSNLNLNNSPSHSQKTHGSEYPVSPYGNHPPVYASNHQIDDSQFMSGDSVQDGDYGNENYSVYNQSYVSNIEQSNIFNRSNQGSFVDSAFENGNLNSSRLLDNSYAEQTSFQQDDNKENVFANNIDSSELNNRSKESASKIYGGSIGITPITGQDEYFTLGEEDQNDFYQPNYNSMAYKPSQKSKMKSRVSKKPKKYGNEHPYVSKMLDIISDMPIRKSGTELKTVLAISGHSGYLCNRTNIFEFRWKDPYSTLKPHFLTQGNFTDILSIAYLYRNPIFLAKKDQDLNFYRLKSNKKFQLLASSKYNPFEQKSYKNAICVSKDRNFVFLREKENKLILYRHKSTKEQGTVLKKIGMSEFNEGLSIHQMFYEYRNKLLLILFSNCQYAVDSVKYTTGIEQQKESKNPSRRSARKRREKRNRSRQTERSILKRSPHSKGKDNPVLVTEQRPTDLTNTNSEYCNLVSSCIGRDRKSLFCSVWDAQSSVNKILMYRRYGSALDFCATFEIRNLESKF